MARSVVLNSSPRCIRCYQPRAWCLCAWQEPVGLPWAVDVLMHQGEMVRPTSTGHLIQRLVPGSGQHLFRPAASADAESVRRPGHTLWVLHPFGDDLPCEVPEPLQVVLVDGTWKQASTMVRAISSWGRKVRLPMTGTSRYWLRNQQGEGQFSTIEALMFLLEAAGRSDEARRLRVAFELQVYAGLSLRGDRRRRDAYLETSAVRAALTDLLARRDAQLRPVAEAADAPARPDRPRPDPAGPSG